jgi:hypothetical protein
METHAIKCDSCTGGFIGDQLCGKCDGDGSIIVTDRAEHPDIRRARIIQRVLAWFVIIGAVVGIAYAIVKW